MKEKEGANVIGGGLRRETWIHPGDGRRVRRTTSAATANEARLSHTSDLEELSQLTSVEVSIPLANFAAKRAFSITMTRLFQPSARFDRCRLPLMPLIDRLNDIDRSDDIAYYPRYQRITMDNHRIHVNASFLSPLASRAC
jgi:hypothetical protein